MGALWPCGACPDEETHDKLVDGRVVDYARAHGETNETVLTILDAEDD